MNSPAVQLPETTRRQLESFQARVRVVKVTEGVLAGIFGLALSWLVIFIVDRFVDTHSTVRAIVLLSGALGFGLFFPLKCHRWVWRTRQMEQVATLLKHRFPALGDQLLGVVELSRNGNADGSSDSLTKAAITHVDEAVRGRDFSDAVPNPRNKTWAMAAGIPFGLMLIALAVVPDAGVNALKRWLMPWANVDRYTFAQVEMLPDEIVVPHGEEFEFSTQLSDSTKWAPATGAVFYNEQKPIVAELADGEFQFNVPPQTETGTLNVRIGDIREAVSVQVATRPELDSLIAEIQLPQYLKYSRPIETDVRGGVISILKGSVAEFAAKISRQLQSATIQGESVVTEGDTLAAKPISVTESETLEIQWKDELGLTAKDGFQLKIKAVDDTQPVVGFQQLDPNQVVLSTDVISFDVQANDDFGLKEVGIAWDGIEDPLRNPHPNTGDKAIKSGSPEEVQFSGKATFCAVSDNVPAQSLKIQAYAEDYNPEKGRSYSPTYILHVLAPEEHAVWITHQMRRWASLADDVYEEEMRLHDENRELRRMAPGKLNTPKTRKRIENQAAAERANGQRLGAVTDQGEQLIKQAMRNKEMLVGHLEAWAAALEGLKEIGDNRMPSVADLLDTAAKSSSKKKAPPGAPATAKSSPSVGNNRSEQAGDGKQDDGKQSKTSSPATPSVADVESGFLKTEESDKKSTPSSSGKGKLGLPTTTLNGGLPPGDEEPPPASAEMDEAVEQQADLLADFAKIREELQKIMDDLENSTFVKRFKAASRQQLEVADDLNRTLFKGFGVTSEQLDDRQEQQTERLAIREEAQSQAVWLIQSDLEAFYDRRKSKKFLKIIDEMDELRVATKLTGMSERIRKNLAGESIARAEFWGDTLDRWAEELVDASPGGT